MDENYNNDIENINKFLSTRPDVLGCFCYAIGDYFYKKAYKLILVTDDIWSWQENNNEQEFSMYSNVLYRDGYDFIHYIGIIDNNNIFDYTLMSGSEFISDIYHWNNISLAEIFQRPFITIKSINEFDDIINRNRQNALIVSSLSLSEHNKNFYDLMLNMYAMSSYKSNDNISLVNKDYDLLKSIYEKYDFISFEDNYNIFIDYDKISKLLLYLPSNIKKYIYGNQLDMNYVRHYLKEKKYKEIDEFDYMIFLINGLFKTMSYNGRSCKVKTISK